MPASAGRLRYMLSRLIGRDPVSLTLARTTRVRSGGGYTNAETQHGPYRARIVPTRAAEARDVASLGGVRRSDFGWVLLVLAPAEIVVAPEITTRVAHPRLGNFVVADFTEVGAAGEVAGYIVDLERGNV